MPSLHPHRPYDFAIDLLPSTPLPSSRLSYLFRPEQEAMETDIRKSLASGLIVPSSSPVEAGSFFVKKKDGTLRPCIDYCGLNNITVRNRATASCQPHSVSGQTSPWISSRVFHSWRVTLW